PILDAAGISYVRPKGAFYLFPKAPIADDVKFCALLKDERILAVPGSGFGLAGHIRLAFCVEEKVIRASAEGFKNAVAAAKKL
ncbi:MAG: aminotransferase class I/II-fold pyridoxal phosphate-dependent enzyme, partial [Deltaproteobacteria bacterium]|nr:aminotransferase class I/II-fold pyridoxal phosphate-dependent enzyme [Deltaproteobacteria bacterium]